MSVAKVLSVLEFRAAERAPEIRSQARGRVLKYRADRLPTAYVVAMLALHVAIWATAGPWVAVASTVPLAVAGFFIAPINHHHQHLNVFRSPAANRVYDLALALQTGVAPFAWVLHHNLGHHAHYLQQRPHEQPDESTWTRANGAKMGRVEYTLYLLMRHQWDIVRIGLQYPKVFRRFLWMKLPLYALLGAAFWLQPWNTTFVFVVPGLLVLTHTIWATYEHHAGCETDEHVAASVNRINPLYNRLTGNLGYHTAHHMRPGMHWSLLPKLHAEIEAKIPERCVLTTFW
jgi:fatty acid desaturase